eukprot:939585-Amphidinium_carterae.1
MDDRALKTTLVSNRHFSRQLSLLFSCDSELHICNERVDGTHTHECCTLEAANLEMSASCPVQFILLCLVTPVKNGPLNGLDRNLVVAE